MSKLKVGTIGRGFIGPVHMLAAAMNYDIAEPFAFADDDESKHGDITNAGLTAYKNADDLISNPEIDVVHIAGPDEFHAQWALAAMDAGKKVVVVEKPMTKTLDEAVNVLERAIKFEADGGVLMTNFNYMGHALPRATRELRQRGYFGKEDYMFLAEYLQDWLMVNQMLSIDEKVRNRLTDGWNWRLDGKMCASKDILPHLMGAAYFITGSYPVEVMAQSATFISSRVKEKGAARTDAFKKSEASEKVEQKEVEIVPLESDLYTNVVVRFQNGAQGNFIVTQALAGHKNDWYFMYGGSQRSATWYQKEPNTLWIGQSIGLNKDPRDPPNRIYDPGQVGNITIANDGGALTAMGCTNAAQYCRYPGEHPPGHIDAFEKQFGTAYRAALDPEVREGAVLPGAHMGFMCVAVADAVLRSREAGGQWVKVDYRGVEGQLKQGKL